MAFKEWKDGDYVQASDLDTLTTAGNLTFANAAARDAFLVGDLAPVAGMFVHMLDDNTTYKRITVGGVSYWSPPPGYFVCAYQQSSASAIGAGSYAQITNLQTVYGRSSPWWGATNRFTPLCPGFYQFDGQIAWANTASDMGRGAFLCLNNNASIAQSVPGSWTMMRPNANVVVTYPLRTCAVYMNGTTDFITLCGFNESTTTLNTSVVAATGLTTISIKYLGP